MAFRQPAATFSLSCFFILLASAPFHAQADEAWRCVKDEKVVRVYLANLQPDIAVPCEVRVERNGIIYQIAHEEIDLNRCNARAENAVETYENQGYVCTNE